jgi:hypothetical protein
VVTDQWDMKQSRELIVNQSNENFVNESISDHECVPSSDVEGDLTDCYPIVHLPVYPKLHKERYYEEVYCKYDSLSKSDSNEDDVAWSDVEPDTAEDEVSGHLSRWGQTELKQPELYPVSYTARHQQSIDGHGILKRQEENRSAEKTQLLLTSHDKRKHHELVGPANQRK